jgi:hypothetical protein
MERLMMEWLITRTRALAPASTTPIYPFKPRRGGHGASLRALCTTASVGRILLQDVQTNAVLVHCHSAPSAALEIGLGYAKASETKAAAPVSVTAAPINASFLVVHHVPVISVAPVEVRGP